MKKYNDDIYSMYEEEVAKNKVANNEIKNLKLKIYVPKYFFTEI